MALTGKWAIITGASSGIGRASAISLAQKKVNLILFSRSLDALKTLSLSIEKDYGVRVLYRLLDVRDVVAVQETIAEIASTVSSIDILINNAGLALGLHKIQEGNVNHWSQMIDTNIKGLLYMTRYVVPFMLKQNSGHIVNIGSISSHEVYSGGAVYCSTKFAVKAISRGLKMDLHGTPIKVSEIEPGLVKTNFARTRFGGDTKAADAVYKGMEALTAEDVADAIIFCLTRPSHVSVPTLHIYPQDQSASHMVFRRTDMLPS